VIFFAISIGLAFLIYLAFFSDPKPEPRYWYWDATVTFIWYEGAESGKAYALGKSRYKVRLPNGSHQAARSFNDEQFNLYDCVRVRQTLSVTAAIIPYEIIGRADNCWKPLRF
jgi:hypothetical protein